ncbi:MAG: signal recognition particle-docking protein FtsY [Aquiluna sp.]|nr:signal recognition particle-docking protein FtsY [Aquiluna sp.]
MFKFLKRLRGDKGESPKAEQTQSTEDVKPEVIQTPPIAWVPGAVEPELVKPEVVKPEVVESVAIEAPAEEPVATVVEPEPEKQPEPEMAPAKIPVATIETPAVVEVELPERGLGDGIRSLFSSEVDLEDLEDILLRADFGVDASIEITDALKKAANKAGASSDAELRLLLKDLLVEKLTRSDAALNLSTGDLPYVILVVGVNGAGKTTTIGKLSRWLKDGDWSVVLGAADTFRAAAVEQLATWADRAEAKIVRPEREGQDPASVAYQTVELALRDDADIAIIDTAGRLQNKKDLMDELGKIRRAVEKQAVITEVLLVIDSTTGQNAIAQAKAFTEVADVTGIVMTKLDGTAKGGIVYSLQQQLDLPVKLVGVGEGINDFAFFSPEEFAKGLVAYRSR